jgi:hypothetical protein
MRAHRALALFATAGAMLVAAASAALVGPGAAAAAPVPAPPGAASGNPQGYPPPPPLVVVSRGTVTAGQKVRFFGNHFGLQEPVVVTIKFVPVTSASPATAAAPGKRTAGVVTDLYGRFRVSLALSIPGKAVISARGTRSHLSASVTVKVLSAPAPTVPTKPSVTQHGKPGAQAPAAAAKANLVSSSRELAAGKGQVPMGAVGGAAALLGGCLLTALAFRRRRTSSDS